MPKPLAREGDRIVATDIHLSTSSPPVSISMPFSGTLRGGTVAGVTVNGWAAAVVGSIAWNDVPHTCSDPATNQGTVVEGSSGVLIGGRPAARAGDRATTCQVTGPAPLGAIVASNRVTGA